MLNESTMADSYTDQPQTFDEFWDFYVSQHLNPTCRAMHFIGTTGVIGCVAATPVFPLALAAAPVCGYGFAWFSHMVFEKNRPATFTYPRWSLIADFVMYKKMLFREMNGEVERVKDMMRSQGFEVPGENLVPAESV